MNALENHSPGSTDKNYFENLYRKAADPFRNWGNEYETSKRTIALNLLSEERYARAFEPGCGNGGLSLVLSERCDSLLSADWSSDALIAAQLHCAGVHNVDFQELDFPRQQPRESGFDLLMVSELLYYYSPEMLELFFKSMRTLVRPGGEIMLIHWRGLSSDYPSSGDAVHHAFETHPDIHHLRTYTHPQYLISSGRLV